MLEVTIPSPEEAVAPDPFSVPSPSAAEEPTVAIVPPEEIAAPSEAPPAGDDAALFPAPSAEAEASPDVSAPTEFDFAPPAAGAATEEDAAAEAAALFAAGDPTAGRVEEVVEPATEPVSFEAPVVEVAAETLPVSAPSETFSTESPASEAAFLPVDEAVEPDPVTFEVPAAEEAVAAEVALNTVPAVVALEPTPEAVSESDPWQAVAVVEPPPETAATVELVDAQFDPDATVATLTEGAEVAAAADALSAGQEAWLAADPVASEATVVESVPVEQVLMEPVAVEAAPLQTPAAVVLEAAPAVVPAAPVAAVPVDVPATAVAATSAAAPLAAAAVATMSVAATPVTASAVEAAPVAAAAPVHEQASDTDASYLSAAPTSAAVPRSGGRAMPKHVTVSQLWFVLILSYASAITVMILYLVFGAKFGTAHQLESLPDVVPKETPAGKIRTDLVSQGASMPPGHTLMLGQSQRYGNLRVTPLKVVKEPIEFTHFEKPDLKKPPGETVLKLWVRLENVSPDQEFMPFGRDLLFNRHRTASDAGRERANNFVCPLAAKRKAGSAVLIYPHTFSDVWDLKDLNIDYMIPPGQTFETYIPTDPDGIEKLKGELVWRIHFRKGLNAKSGRGVTTMVEVVFNSDQIETPSAVKPDETPAPAENKDAAKPVKS